MDGSEVSLRDCDCGHWTGCNAKVTDEALIGELVKRGKLFRNVDKRSVWPTLDRVLMECFVSNWEPVGSVSEGEG